MGSVITAFGDMECSAQAAANFQPGDVVVGYITAMETIMPKHEFKPSITVRNPANPTENIEVVAVLTRVFWPFQMTASISFEGLFAPDNAEFFSDSIAASRATAELVVSWQVWKYDFKEMKQFITFESGEKPIRGIVSKDTERRIALKNSGIIPGKPTFAFAFSMHADGANGPQQLTYATSVSAKTQHNFGSS